MIDCSMLVVPDVHRPVHNHKAWDLVLKVVSDAKPDLLAQLGDLGDYEAVSSHSKKFGVQRALKREVDSTREAARELRQAHGKKKKRYWIQGNHEERFERYAAANAPELEDFLPTGAQLLGVETGEVWCPYRSDVQVGKVTITHDVGHSGKNATAQTLDSVGHCVVSGHTHRGGIVFDGTVLGERRFSMSCGWLGDVDKITYMHRSQMRGWQLGFGWLRFDKRGRAWPTFCPILDDGRTVVLEGKEYRV